MSDQRPIDCFRLGLALATFIAIGFAPAAGAVLPNGPHSEPKICTDTARFQLRACRAEATDDANSGFALCLNSGDRVETRDCFQEVRAQKLESKSDCKDQYNARRDVCAEIGEGAYNPEFVPELFISDYTNPFVVNPHYPVRVGNYWDFSTGDESNRKEIVERTKNIEGVTCVVMRDQAEGDGFSEDTDDWIAVRLNGDVDYCGEEVKDYELFEGDVPLRPELVSIDGSFKAGRDGDKSGTLFTGSPSVGVAYRQEWSAGNAEDWVLVLSTTYRYGEDAELDTLVPAALAELLCSDSDCVVTRDGTPLEPEAHERKFYAPGLGLFLEVNLVEDHANQLVGCNTSPLCSDLPEPEFETEE